MNFKAVSSTLGVVLTGVLLVPYDAVLAAPPNFQALMEQLTELVDLGTFTLFGLAIAYFFWSVVRNLWGFDGASEERSQKLRETLIWGILVLFVMVSIWGIIEILQITLGRGLG